MWNSEPVLAITFVFHFWAHKKIEQAQIIIIKYKQIFMKGKKEKKKWLLQPGTKIDQWPY